MAGMEESIQMGSIQMGELFKISGHKIYGENYIPMGASALVPSISDTHDFQ